MIINLEIGAKGGLRSPGLTVISRALLVNSEQIQTLYQAKPLSLIFLSAY